MAKEGSPRVPESVVLPLPRGLDGKVNLGSAVQPLERGYDGRIVTPRPVGDSEIHPITGERVITSNVSPLTDADKKELAKIAKRGNSSV